MLFVVKTLLLWRTRKYPHITTYVVQVRYNIQVRTRPDAGFETLQMVKRPQMNPEFSIISINVYDAVINKCRKVVVYCVFLDTGDFSTQINFNNVSTLVRR